MRNGVPVNVPGATPDAFAEVKPVLEFMFKDHDDRFKFNKDETKYESSYKASIDKANEDAKKSKAAPERASQSGEMS